jgi:hypothetical protein
MAKSPRTKPLGGGPKGKAGFPIGNDTHARLAIGGATRSYNAGNISKSKEDEVKAAARAKLGEGRKAARDKRYGSYMRTGK